MPPLWVYEVPGGELVIGQLRRSHSDAPTIEETL